MTPALLMLFALPGLGLTYWFALRRWYRHWGATAAEIERGMCGDAEVPRPAYETTLAVTIDAPPADIWPWLLQIGYRRGGLYSYDWLDRLFGFLDAPSAERILPEYQHLEVGDAIPVGRGAEFPVTAADPGRALVMSGEQDGFHWTWQFGLYPIDEQRTRLVSRNRADLPRTIGSAFFMVALEPAAFIMTRKMLLGLKRRAEARDVLLDRFIPAYDVVERHHIRIDAPAATVYEAAGQMDLERSPIVRTIFRAREWLMRSHPSRLQQTAAFLAQMRAIGWGTLAEVPGREIVMGAVTKPWMADVVFRPLPAGEFAAFCEPDYVKIAWTLRADPRADGSTFRTETRAIATDAAAWKKFRWYWAFASPGIRLIRWAALRPLKSEAESLSASYRRDVARALARVPPAAPVVKDADLAHLPAPIQRYLHTAGVVGQPRVYNVRARVHGRIRSGRDARWIALSAEQHNFFDEPARFFYFTGSMYLIPVQGYHRYVGPAATMTVKAAGLVPIVEASGDEMSQGETVTMFNDMCVMAPATLIDPAIAWEAVDGQTVKASFTNAGHTIRAELSFNDAGELTNFRSDDRFQTSPDGKSARKVRWSTPLGVYRSFGSARLAGSGEGRWHEASGDYAYIELTIDDVQYNVSADEVAGNRRHKTAVSDKV